MMIKKGWRIKGTGHVKYLVHECMRSDNEYDWHYCFTNEAGRWECSGCEAVSDGMVQDVADLAGCWEFGSMRYPGVL